jgi:hypothetical protein
LVTAEQRDSSSSIKDLVDLCVSVHSIDVFVACLSQIAVIQVALQLDELKEEKKLHENNK